MKYTNNDRRDTLYKYWYIQQLHFTDFHSFSLVTFRAAVNYLIDTNFHHIVESKRKTEEQVTYSICSFYHIKS